LVAVVACLAPDHVYVAIAAELGEATILTAAITGYAVAVIAQLTGIVATISARITDARGAVGRASKIRGATEPRRAALRGCVEVTGRDRPDDCA
jgi:hypothetical protein